MASSVVTVRIGLVQANMDLTWSSPTRGESAQGVRFGLLPYSVALLQSYAQAHAAERHEFLVPVHRRVAVDEAVAALDGADLVGFSAYIWNVRLSLQIAAALKAQRPEVQIVFGGPQVPDRAEAFLRENPFIDVVCHGEGEVTFTRILDAAAGRDFSGIEGTSCLRDGAFTHTPRRARLKDMEQIPSPFLGGAFDALIEAWPDEQWVAMWETNRGCPFSCSFCDWGSATNSKVYRFEMERLMDELEWLSAHRVAFLFCCDANFGMLKRDIEIARAIVDIKQRTGYPSTFSVQNTKNAVERGYQVQKLLNQSLNAYGATISVQSVNETTLANIKRANISTEAFTELQRRFAHDGVYTYTDIIIGLPGETYDEFADGIAAVIAAGQHNHIQFHNCSVLPNAEMGDPAYQARFGMRLQPQAIRNVHARVDDVDEVAEYLDLVVGTDAMGPEDWCRAKVFAWLSDLAYFDRVLQVPLAVLMAEHGVSVRPLIEALTSADPERHPVTHRLHARLLAHARAIQRGGPEYIAAPEWGNVIWPADQHALLSIVAAGELDAFYHEAVDLLGDAVRRLGIEDQELLILDALTLARSVLRVPGRGPTKVVLSHNLGEYYAGVLKGRPVELRQEIARYVIDRSVGSWSTIEEWCEHLTWCHNKDKRGYAFVPRRVGGPQPALALAG
jgi:radical SAM superfamily enzyme YgiQ (UPF0313 family)